MSKFANFLYLFRLAQVYSLKIIPEKYFQKSIERDDCKIAPKFLIGDRDTTNLDPSIHHNLIDHPVDCVSLRAPLYLQNC